MSTEKEMRANGLVKYEELQGKAKKQAYERVAWNFVENKWADLTEEQIQDILNRQWFTTCGGTHVGTN